MLEHHFAPKVTEADKDRLVKLINDKPWIVPSTMLLEIIPVSIVAYGFFRNCRLRTKLKIEREKTMQAYMKRTKSGEMSMEEQHFLKRL
ncbi:hypothetical protein M5C72_04655 [Companilactobacillus allii]|uniref:Transposase n=1 Tax=Companilactobacillus allii TaxID=1847728 RepID=A0A1P8Q3I6_9LACO|nr:hypothetical protein [Companilactobacillus allii]APX72421.1 hypothetical protein BTM29_07595 [Companilactobacillus allii]USQ69516.1 hypothetical protein M5C72_04655 [Companilactobacillus allii]